MAQSQAGFGFYDSVKPEDKEDRTCPHCTGGLQKNIDYDVCPHCHEELTTNYDKKSTVKHGLDFSSSELPFSDFAPDQYDVTVYGSVDGGDIGGSFVGPDGQTWQFDSHGDSAMRGSEASFTGPDGIVVEGVWLNNYEIFSEWCDQLWGMIMHAADPEAGEGPAEGRVVNDEVVEAHLIDDDLDPYAAHVISKFRVVALGELQQPSGVGATAPEAGGEVLRDDRPGRDMSNAGDGSPDENHVFETWVRFAVQMLNEGKSPEQVQAELAISGCPDPRGATKAAVDQPVKDDPGGYEGAQDPFDVPFQDGQGDAQLEDVHNQPPALTSSWKTASEWSKPWEEEDEDDDDEEKGDEKKEAGRDADGYGDTPYQTTEWECPECGAYNYESAGPRGGANWHDCETCGYSEQSPTDFNRRRAPSGWNERDQGRFDYWDDPSVGHEVQPMGGEWGPSNAR